MTEALVEIRSLQPGDSMWTRFAKYAEDCSWRAGKGLARQMLASDFQEYERVFAALVDGVPAGFCTLAKKDCIEGVPYTPYIGYVFVGEPFRRHRLSQRLVRTAAAAAKEAGFSCVYLVSDHVGLYEKFGFYKIDEKPAPWNPDTMESIFMLPI